MDPNGARRLSDYPLQLFCTFENRVSAVYKGNTKEINGFPYKLANFRIELANFGKKLERIVWEAQRPVGLVNLCQASSI